LPADGVSEAEDPTKNEINRLSVSPIPTGRIL
jgi:hypothetical protein